MGLRDSYLSALVARCVVAVTRACNTQQPASLLHVALPRETQHATNDQALPTAAAAATLHATNDATITQQAQHDDLAGLPAWTDAEIVSFDKRVARSTWLSYPNAKCRAERLLHRDRDIDDRRLCVECQHAGPGWRCAKREAFMLDQLQRCPRFKEKPL